MITKKNNLKKFKISKKKIITKKIKGGYPPETDTNSIIEIEKGFKKKHEFFGKKKDKQKKKI